MLSKVFRPRIVSFFFNRMESSLNVLESKPFSSSSFNACYKIIKKRHRENPCFWAEIKKQVELIENNNHHSQNQFEQINFGPQLIKKYDSAQEVKEMEPLYSLYYRTRMK